MSYSFTPCPPVSREAFAAALREGPAPLLILVDQQGSMAPFELLLKELLAGIELAADSASSVRFFHDAPQVSFTNAAMSKGGKLLGSLLPEVRRYRGVLIVGDAGAAHGWFDSLRVKETGDDLHLLRSTGVPCAWLNPMPEVRWASSSAGDIAALVPMFALDEGGVRAALESLREEAADASFC